MLVGIGFLLVGSGCGGQGEAVEGELVLSELVLPHLVGTINCETIPAAPDLCTWAQSLDLLVWGKIAAVRPVVSPSVLGSGLVETCAGQVNAALEIDLAIEDVVLGSESGTITVRVGFDQVSSWRPMPVVETDGKLKWLGEGGDALRVGQKIGAPLFFDDASKSWLLLSEPLLTERLDGDGVGRVAVQDMSGLECSAGAPSGLPGLEVARLKATIEACSVSDKAGQRKVDTLERGERNPGFAYASVCIAEE